MIEETACSSISRSTLIDEPYGHGHRALEDLGVTRKQIRDALSELIADGPNAEEPGYFPQTPRVKHVMKLAVEEARQLKSPDIGTEHLLLALLGEPEGVAMKALESLGVQADNVRDKVLTMLEEERNCS